MAPHQIRTISRIQVQIDRNTLKNAYAVPIPNTEGRRGIELAAALGVFCDPEKRLRLFEDLTSRRVSKARRLLKEGSVEISLIEDPSPTPKLHIISKVEIGDHSGTSELLYEHCNVISVKKNGTVLYEKKTSEEGGMVYDEDIKALSKMGLPQILSELDKLSDGDKSLISRSIELNERAAGVGGTRGKGLSVGLSLKRIQEKKLLLKDLVQEAEILTSSATDARMSGQEILVMSCGGSGNQGLTASLPIIAVARRVPKDKDRVLKSLALSYLITLYVTYYLGYLSPLCGCALKAGIGATAGVTYYLGGSDGEIEAAIKNLIGSVAGMICDGGKITCALKSATSAAVAVQSAILALEGVEPPPGDGIIYPTVEETIMNLGELSKAMMDVDRKIVSMIMNMRCNHSKGSIASADS